jgi:O-antigen/teichoic acid export membrane protein
MQYFTLQPHHNKEKKTMRALAFISALVFLALLVCMLFLIIYLTNIYHPFSDNGSGKLILLLFLLILLPIAGLLSTMLLLLKLYKLKGMNSRIGLDYPFTEFSNE